MRRPEEVWISGARWAISWLDYELVVDGHCAYGCTDLDRREISLSLHSNPVPAALRQTLVHELLHAAVSTGGGVWHDSEETGIRSLERQITSIFEDERNRPLLRWLMRSD